MFQQVKVVLLRIDGIAEIKMVNKTKFHIPMSLEWPDGRKGTFKKLSAKGYLYYQEV